MQAQDDGVGFKAVTLQLVRLSETEHSGQTFEERPEAASYSSGFLD